MADTARQAVHRTMVLVDVEGYSSATRTLPHQLGTRAGLYAVVGEALAAAGVPWDACHCEDRGDGLFLLIPPEYPKAPLVEVLPEALARAVRGHNSISHDAARVRLRLAIHAGEVAFDGHGATSPTMVAAFRLVDAAPLREALAGTPGVLVLIVSRLVFDEVVRNSTTVDPATFRPVEVAVKSFRDRAWIALPDHPYPADPAVLDHPSHFPATGSVPGGRAPVGSESGTGRTEVEDFRTGPRGVHIAGGVHGAGAGITVGAVTGGHLTINPSPARSPAGAEPQYPLMAKDLEHTSSVPASDRPIGTCRPAGTSMAAQQVRGDVTADTGGTAIGILAGGLHLHPPPPRPSVPTPRQLGPRPAGFVGRADQLAALDRALVTDTRTGDGGHGTGGTAVISAIGGTGGIGKTWLAQTWAHRNLHRFPDGQLATDLRGFSPGDSRRPVDVLGDFLAALGVDRDRQPTDLDARIGLYRTHTTGKRLLVLLDNAARADQILPLLPGGDTCTVLITSRDRLRSLVARHDARPVHLDILTETEAHTLLTTALDSTTDTDQAIPGLVELCGGFPLALGLIAARIRTRPHLLHDIAAELRDLGLDALDSDDPDASLPTVLSWSLRHLTHAQRTLFALLGIAPGPDTTPPAVAALTGQPRAHACKALTALEEASLLERRPGGRYAMHDLVRAFATTTAHTLPDGVQKAALVRVTDFHLHTAHTADRLLDPQGTLVRPEPPAPGIHPHPLPDAAAAMAWLDAEHTTLLATQRTAAALSRHLVVWHLAWVLDIFHFRRGHRRDALNSWRIALEAAEHLPDFTTRSRAHRNLSSAYSRMGLHEEATDHLDRALKLAVRHRDPTEQAHTHRVLALVWGSRGDARRALDHAHRALDLFRTLDLSVWEAVALNLVGWHSARLGELDAARDCCHAALVMHRDHRNLDGESNTLDSLGFIARRAGEHQQAVDYYHQALTLYRALDNAYQVADALDHTGHPHAALGRHEQARVAWREALELYREQGRTFDAERVQRQLDDLDDSTDPGRTQVQV
ncbi:tetratricopeptide repeat protein [Actinosynnema sp. NPDC023587]|uniref:tetratricopeptide repeat protein n=1 Tax=Actinosynnema sp. NPDC023587 TaxID=3154695 RepID=UPI0033E6429E